VLFPPLHLPHPNNPCPTSFWFFISLLSLVSTIILFGIWSLDLLQPLHSCKPCAPLSLSPTNSLIADVTCCGAWHPCAAMACVGCTRQHPFWFPLVDLMVLYFCSSSSLPVKLLCYKENFKSKFKPQNTLTLLLFVSQTIVETHYLIVHLPF